MVLRPWKATYGTKSTVVYNGTMNTAVYDGTKIREATTVYEDTNDHDSTKIQWPATTVLRLRMIRWYETIWMAMTVPSIRLLQRYEII